MPSYILLVDRTQHGVETIEQTPDRSARVEDMIEELGGEVSGVYRTFGRYDAIAVFDLPDDAAAMQVKLRGEQGGTHRSELLRGFDDNEYAEVIASLTD